MNKTSFKRVTILFHAQRQSSDSGHNSNIRHRNEENKGTKLSRYIWYLKDRNIRYSMDWKILGTAKSYNPVTDKCRLCHLEKYFIMFNPDDATLNLREEIFAQCMHKKKHLLSRTKTWPQDQVGFFKNLFKYPTFRFWYWTYVFCTCTPQCQQSLMIAFWAWNSIVTLRTYKTCFI